MYILGDVSIKVSQRLKFRKYEMNEWRICHTFAVCSFNQCVYHVVRKTNIYLITSSSPAGKQSTDSFSVSWNTPDFFAAVIGENTRMRLDNST